MSILRRIAFFFFCLGCLPWLGFALDATERAEIPAAKIEPSARKPQPKATMGAQRFKTVPVKKQKGVLRHVRHGMFKVKKKRTPKLVHTQKRGTFGVQHRAGKFADSRKTYAQLQPWESRRFDTKQGATISEEAFVEDLNLQSETWENQREVLSMAEINRFQYRETHSSEAGVPVQIAGNE